MKVKKITDQQTIAESFNEYFITIVENVKRQSKNNSINEDNDTMESHTCFMEQAFTKPSLNLTVSHPKFKQINTSL